MQVKIKWLAVGLLIFTLAGASVAYKYARSFWYPSYVKLAGKRTVSDVVARYGPEAMMRLERDLEAAQFYDLPDKLALISYKDTRVLELWGNVGEQWRLVKTYTVKAASGVLGPKLREGDYQVPEGIYSIEGLNPNSSYHLSIKLNYPNEFDQKWARAENRLTPGTNIFIHGKAVSVGCLAMGDPAIEELFVLINKVGRSNVTVVISPTNPKLRPLTNPFPERKWVDQLYSRITNTINSIQGLSVDTSS